VWKFWKKCETREQEIADQLKTEAFKIVGELTSRWVRYQDLVPFAPSVPLAARMPGFTLQAQAYVDGNHPVMKTATPAMIDEMVWLAVIQSGTHGVPQVNEARAAHTRMTDREKVSAEGAAVVAFLKGKWLYFCNALHFKEGAPLSERIAMFIPPAREGVANNFPAYRDAPMEMLQQMVAVALMEGGTDPILVDAAMTELKTRGGGR
jgi:hypothetical protein